MGLDIRIIKKRENVYAVKLKGSIDTETTLQLEKELKKIIDEKTKAVVFDMSGVDYINSVGIRLIVNTQKTLQAQQATFALTNLQPPIKKLFEIMKILTMIDVFDDVEVADKYIDQIAKEVTKKPKK